MTHGELQSPQAIADQNTNLEIPNPPTTLQQTAERKYGYEPPVSSALTDPENDGSAIRLSRLTPQNWQYILTQAQACDSERERFEQVQQQLEHQLRNTAGRLAEADAELEEKRNKPSKQVETHRTFFKVGDDFQQRGTLDDLKMVAADLRAACSGFKTRSEEAMAEVTWMSSKTQEAVKSVEQKLEELDKVIQACCQR